MGVFTRSGDTRYLRGMAGQPSFAAVVRKEMAARLPRYRFVSTGGGSGPLVTFERPSAAKHPRLRQEIVFQKGLHGGTWFRVNLTAQFEGDGACGRPTLHSLSEGTTLGPDVRWTKPDEMVPLVEAAVVKLDAKAKVVFGRFEKRYAKDERFFGRLVVHYSDWFRREGEKLPQESFYDDEATNSVPAFDAFVRWLAKKKLAAGLGDTKTFVWRFWNGGRPMRATDYQKGDYYDCTKCSAFVSLARARLVKKRDPVFGTHFDFVCAKH